MLEPPGRNVSEIWMEIQNISFKKMHLKIFAFCSGLNVLRSVYLIYSKRSKVTFRGHLEVTGVMTSLDTPRVSTRVSQDVNNHKRPATVSEHMKAASGISCVLKKTGVVSASMDDYLGICWEAPGPCFNIKTVFPRYGDSHVIFNLGIPMLTSLYWDAPQPHHHHHHHHHHHTTTTHHHTTPHPPHTPPPPHPRLTLCEQNSIDTIQLLAADDLVTKGVGASTDMILTRCQVLINCSPKSVNTGTFLNYKSPFYNDPFSMNIKTDIPNKLYFQLM